MHGPSQPQLVFSLALTTLHLVCFLILPPHYSPFPSSPWTFLMTSRMMSSSVENDKSKIRILDTHTCRCYIHNKLYYQFQVKEGFSNRHDHFYLMHSNFRIITFFLEAYIIFPFKQLRVKVH